MFYSASGNIIYIYIHTHTHTHSIYILICISLKIVHKIHNNWWPWEYLLLRKTCNSMGTGTYQWYETYPWRCLPVVWVWGFSWVKIVLLRWTFHGTEQPWYDSIIQDTVLHRRYGTLAEWKRWGCTTDQKMVTVQGTLICPPYSM
jgi:hypothetical protein